MHREYTTPRKININKFILSTLLRGRVRLDWISSTRGRCRTLGSVSESNASVVVVVTLLASHFNC